MVWPPERLKKFAGHLDAAVLLGYLAVEDRSQSITGRKVRACGEWTFTKGPLFPDWKSLFFAPQVPV
jgi:hypothetical protein